VNLVEDYGADPTGSDPVDDQIASATEPNTLIIIPDGEYLFSDEVYVSPKGNVGFLAEDGAEPRFVASPGHNDNLLNIYDLPAALFEGIDIDIQQSETTAGLRVVVSDRFHIQDVTYLGRGTHPDSDVTNALTLELGNSDGTGIVRNVKALKGSAIGNYKSGEGRTGAWVGGGTNGTVRFENCRFEEFGNNGLYCGRTPGNVQVIGGTYRNNNIANVRIAGDGSYIENATVEVNVDQYTGPAPGTEAYNTRGIVIDPGSTSKPPGARVTDCEVIMETVDSSSGAVCVVDWADTVDQALYLNRSTITTNDDVRAILAEAGPVYVTDSTIESSINGGCAARLNVELPADSSLSLACTTATGRGRDDIQITVDDSDNYRILVPRGMSGSVIQLNE